MGCSTGLDVDLLIETEGNTLIYYFEWHKLAPGGMLACPISRCVCIIVEYLCSSRFIKLEWRISVSAGVDV